MNLENLVKEFHKKFGIDYDGPPRHLPEELHHFRFRFMQEELSEYKQAVEEGNLEKQFDALIDLVYVALGTAYLQGFPFNNGFALVQLANMTKVKARSAADSTRGYAHDIVKPAGWKAPDLSKLLK